MRVVLTLLAWLFLLAPAATQNIEPISVQLSFVPPANGNAHYDIQLHFTLEKGWKTYALKPGNVGIAPQLVLSKTENIAKWTWEWPAPIRFYEGDEAIMGYDANFTVVLHIEPITSKLPIRFTGQLEMGACSTLCVPITLPVSYGGDAAPRP